MPSPDRVSHQASTMKTLGRLAAVVIARLGLTRSAFRLWELARTLPREPLRRHPAVGTDGLPLPPPLLMVQVAGRADPDQFLAGGRSTAEELAAAMSRAGRPIAAGRSVLDFGAGCGRVARHWARFADDARLHACDYNPRLVSWMSGNLPFITATTNRLEPPLPYEGQHFDCVYALSVFTHLPRGLQFAWMDELWRVLKPGGILLFTTQGDACRHRLETFDRRASLAAYDAGQLAVVDEGMAGTNRCLAYHPTGWVRDFLLSGYALVEHLPSPAGLGNNQDLYVARRLESSPRLPA